MQERVARLFENVDFINGEYEHEGRTLRIVVQERLCPLTALMDVEDITQVLLDVACSRRFPLASRLSHTYAGLVHQWLYEKVGTLH